MASMKETLNGRIFSNTLFLYFRSLLIIAISLYTSRIMLNALGISDFGIYNVVGGIVIIFGFLSSSLSTATQRFLSYELGRDDKVRLKKTFQMSVNIHAFIALLIFLVSDFAGLWFIENHMDIPGDRVSAAKWVLQFSIAAFVVDVLCVPYKASVVANERMSVFAGAGLIEAILKLFAVVALYWASFDKLVMYSFLIFCVTVVVRGFYVFYCTKRFSEARPGLIWDFKLFRRLAGFSSWSLIGGLAFASNTQGVNLLLNVFFGPAVNAARGIAFQIQGAVNSFVINIQTAIGPQIVKSYAVDNHERMLNLVYKGSKYTFFLVFLLTLPMMAETDAVLTYWLGIVPEHAKALTQLTIATVWVDSVSGTLKMAANATGKIMLFQISVGSLMFLALPICYVVLEMGGQPYTAFVVMVVISALALVARLSILSAITAISFLDFVRQVLFKTVLVASVSAAVALSVVYTMPPGLIRFLTVCIASTAVCCSCIWALGLDRQERQFLINTVKNQVAKYR